MQAFQATHFPGHPQTIFQPAADPTVKNDAYDNGEETDLGYYPDGVKRTLTDEQIRIFRHSEIHALLREQQLKQDEAEYEARRQKREDEPRETIRVEKNELSSSETTTIQNDVANAQLPSQQPAKPSRAETNPAESEYLDYGEPDSAPADKEPRQDPRSTHSRRKIVSYDD